MHIARWRVGSALTAVGSNACCLVATSRAIRKYIGGQHPNMAGRLVGDADVIGACGVVVAEAVVRGTQAHAVGAACVARGAHDAVVARRTLRQLGLQS